MPRLAANLSMMFNEVPFEERFDQAAAAGFKGVEFLFPYDHDPNKLNNLISGNNLELVLFNMPPGNWEAGDRGLACNPDRKQDFADNLDKVRDYAKSLNCPSVHMMAGIQPSNISSEQAAQTFLSNLKLAARKLADINVTIMIEPINHHDMPGYFLHHQDQAIELINQANEPNVALQMDFYHCQITEGNLTHHLKKNIKQIGHMQIAGPPDRHEPNTGEVNYPYIFKQIDALNYQGWVGCEYRPKSGTSDGLGWAKPYL